MNMYSSPGHKSSIQSTPDNCRRVS
jgi:hypothetical protein